MYKLEHWPARARNQQCSLGESNVYDDTLPLPNQLALELEAGDIAFYNKYHTAGGMIIRRVGLLHGSVGSVGGSSLQATNVLQHGFSRWIDDLNFSMR